MAYLLAGLLFGGGMVMCCCDFECCEAADDWNILQDARHGERGAGWIYKRAKSKAIWSKRFFVLTESKLIYYTEVDRAVSRGEIVIAGATAQVTTTRKSTKKCKYFTISHPECGEREFYVKTTNRRNQWIQAINELSTYLISYAVYGKLFKQGGLTKSSWQERWAICVGSTLDYFDSSIDNQSKGSIDLIGATIKLASTKDQKYCVEVAANNSSKKGTKKYTFCVERESDQKKWAEALRTASVKRAPRPLNAGNADVSHANPMVKDAAESKSDEMDALGATGGGGFAESERISFSMRTPQEMSGYLQKKSPSAFKGFQKRYFTLKAPGELAYYGSEEDVLAGVSPKGVINLVEVNADTGIDFVEGKVDIVIRIDKRSYPLRANTREEAEAWAIAIGAWVASRGNK